MSLVRALFTAVALVMLGGPAVISGKAGWHAVPRETCRWRDQDFCSDHGHFYWVLSGLFGLFLLLALWAIHRKRGGRLDVL